MFSLCVGVRACVCVCEVTGGKRVWLMLWVLVVGPKLPTDGHRVGWVLGISHIQLYQRLYQSVCLQSLHLSLTLSVSLL